MTHFAQGSLYEALYLQVPFTFQKDLRVEKRCSLEDLFLRGDTKVISRLEPEHYFHAVCMHQEKLISDAELAAFALIYSIKEISSALGGHKLLQNDANFYEGLPSLYKEADLPPLMSLVAKYRIRSVKHEAQLALLGWYLGLFPGKLAFGPVSAEELLESQALGFRYIGIQFSNSLMKKIVPEWQDEIFYKGGFVQHDLCHLAKFRGFPWQEGSKHYYTSQVGLFSWIHGMLPELKTLVSDEGKFHSIKMVFADMNGDVRFLFMALVARLAEVIGKEKLEAAHWYIEKIHISDDKKEKMKLLYDQDRPRFLNEIYEIFATAGADIGN